MTPIIGGLLEMGLKIFDKVLPDAEAKAKAQAELIRLQQAGEFKELEERMGAIKAEAASSDPWTSRARPTFLYVIYIMLLSAIPIGALFVFFPGEVERGIQGFKLWLEAIPQELYMLFGAGYLGYAHYRTADKKIGK